MIRRELFEAAPGSSTSGSKAYFLFQLHDPTSSESGRQQQLTTRLSSELDEEKESIMIYRSQKMSLKKLNFRACLI